MKEGDRLQFNYKDKRVCLATVNLIQGNRVFTTLNKDYIGKNEVWYSGETKIFNLSEMKNIEKL